MFVSECDNHGITHATHRLTLQARASQASTFLTLVSRVVNPFTLLNCIFSASGILDSDLQISLKGIAIGNGWIDARNQYPAYVEYAVARGLLDSGSEVFLCSGTKCLTLIHNE